jgi:glycosyltransferase involved in cell wall biosynthesis
MNKLAILTSHPIQYNAPLFKLLAQDNRIFVKVFYTLGKESFDFIDPGFGKAISWDIPLLEGYDYKFVRNISHIPTSSAFNGIINPTLIGEIEKFGATDILIYGWSFSSHLRAMRYFKNKARIYFRGDSTLLDEKLGLKSLLRRLCLTWVYRHIDVALYVGSNNKDYFLKHGIKETALKFAPHAIDNARFSNNQYESSALELKHELGITENNKVFIFCGKFEWKKNPLLLVRAFNKLHISDVVLVMVGNGPLEEEVKKEAKNNPNIKFLPFQNQSMMPSIYRIGDVVVLPSVTETWGLSVNEAMACGRAIITSDKVGCAINLIQPGKNGFIFKSGDLDDLISSMTILGTKSKADLKKIGDVSNNIINKWTFEATASGLIDLIIHNKN